MRFTVLCGIYQTQKQEIKKNHICVHVAAVRQLIASVNCQMHFMDNFMAAFQFFQIRPQVLLQTKYDRHSKQIDIFPLADTKWQSGKSGVRLIMLNLQTPRQYY